MIDRKIYMRKKQMLVFLKGDYTRIANRGELYPFEYASRSRWNSERFHSLRYSRSRHHPPSVTFREHLFTESLAPRKRSHVSLLHRLPAIRGCKKESICATNYNSGSRFNSPL